jgi:hypothetical protein
MAKPNYRQAKLQKERARKSRQLEKQQKRNDRAVDEKSTPLVDGSEPLVPAADEPGSRQ